MPFAFRHMKLDRPLAVVDLETTGMDPRTDRIIEVGVLKVAPDARPIRYRRLVNPGMPIPPAAHAVHGIGEEDVAEKPRFPAIAPRLARPLEDVDLAGFNIRRLDLPLLASEVARVGIAFATGGRAVLDAQRIDHER